MIPICKMCGMCETKSGGYDGPGFCNDCYSVEQGFLYVNDFGNGLVIDEDGLIYEESAELDGPIACEWRDSETIER